MSSTTNTKTHHSVYRLPISNQNGLDSLTLHTEEIPKPKRHQVLVRIHATSLNYRDILILNGKYPVSQSASTSFIPLSDAAGEIVELGEDVPTTTFNIGDRVCGTFYEDWTDGKISNTNAKRALGGSALGVLSQYRAFEMDSLVKFPSHLTYEQASTLPCAAVTAWNALSENGLQNIGPEQTVLVLGTGGVSVFAIQFAIAAGATVIVTSSSDEKLAKAKELGAQHLINYRKDEKWEETVRKLTPNNRGVDHVIEVGGAGTLSKSLKTVVRGGQVHMIGVLTEIDQQQQSNIGLSVLFGAIVLRGILVGSTGSFVRMNRAIENNKIVPNVDRVFGFSEAREAFEYMGGQHHFGKVVIRVD